jgi:DNA-binding protein H-NS
MARVNLSGMSVEALMDLRKRVDQMLFERRAEIEKRLERMDRAISVVGGASVVGGGGSVLKGRKVPPKYRGPSGETWAVVAQSTAGSEAIRPFLLCTN